MLSKRKLIWWNRIGGRRHTHTCSGLVARFQAKLHQLVTFSTRLVITICFFKTKTHGFKTQTKTKTRAFKTKTKMQCLKTPRLRSVPCYETSKPLKQDTFKKNYQLCPTASAEQKYSIKIQQYKD